MDMLEIKRLQVNTRIGVHAWEQKIQQALFIDISIPIDCNAVEDDLDKTIDYEILCRKITKFFELNSFYLIEKAAIELSNFIKNEFNLTQLTISLSKPHAIKNAQDIRITLVR